MTQMTDGRVKLADHARNVHVVSVPVGVTINDLLVPSYWAHVARKIKPRDRLELWAEDRAWFADAIVVKASRLDVTIRVVSHLDLDAVPVHAPSRRDGYHVDYGGSVDQYRVIRDGDSQVMTLGLTKGEAEQWIEDQVAVETGRLVPMQTAAPAEPVVVPDNTNVGDVTIPDDWRSMSWQDRRSLASKLTTEPIRNGEEANAAIEAALAKRTSAAA